MALTVDPAKIAERKAATLGTGVALTDTAIRRIIVSEELPERLAALRVQVATATTIAALRSILTDMLETIECVSR
jgi:hypothetical protein